MTARPLRRALTRTSTVAALTGLLALGLAACGGEADEAAGADSGTRTFAADNGDVEIPVDPERVVATGYAVPVLIESDADLVGVSEWSRGVPMMTDEDVATYEGLEKVAGETAAETNYEAIAGLDPDLIVIGVPQPALVDLDMDRLEDIAPVVVLGPAAPDSWRELNERQADAAGASEGFEASRSAYEERAAELEEKYADVLGDLRFGHVGAYGDVSAGSFHREYAGSWGTNIAGDIGVDYYGEPSEPGEGAAAVTEYPSIEELPEKLGDADAITYTLGADGKPAEAIAYVLEHRLWKNLPAVRAGHVFGLQHTEAATYTSALRTLDSLDTALEPLLG
ncbi:ABC transporter substrate-binding protein [Nocardioides solisilvae]|uniref:ABC transporter substrate-binding protein n=1 Tax=Nocardioides solisilvae TaxID=1542435 RepID=UPI000D744B88|nr:ABC transporter substrate-binding protein [Nocardioides solisilvae]